MPSGIRSILRNQTIIRHICMKRFAVLLSFVLCFQCFTLPAQIKVSRFVSDYPDVFIHVYDSTSRNGMGGAGVFIVDGKDTLKNVTGSQGGLLM